jgi:hypothetical protein
MYQIIMIICAKAALICTPEHSIMQRTFSDKFATIEQCEIAKDDIIENVPPLDSLRGIFRCIAAKGPSV